MSKKKRKKLTSRPSACAGTEPAPTNGTAPGWKMAVAIAAVLVALVGAVFHRALRFGFISYDDNETVYESVYVIKGLTAEGIRWAFTHDVVGHWDPITTLSHMIDCDLFGLNAWGHHAMNLIFHSVAATLLFVALWKMTRQIYPSAFVAAVFAIHPLRVESVVWVTERKDVLSGTFFVVTLLLYWWYAKHGSAWRYALVALAFALGLMCKSMLVTAPLVLFALDFWPLRRLELGADGWRNAARLLIEKTPLLFLSVAVSIAQVLAAKRMLATLEDFTIPVRLGNAIVSYGEYIWQTLVPVNLAIYYPHPGAALSPLAVVLSLAVLGSITVIAVLWAKSCPWLATGWIWYLTMLLPVIGVIQSSDLARADRYTYLPQVGLLIMFSWSAWRSIEQSGRARLPAALSAAACLVVLGVISYRQTSYWSDTETLWRHAAACTRPNFRAEECIGDLSFFRNDLDEAVAHYSAASKLLPGNASGHVNLGVALAQQNRLPEAIDQFRAAEKIDPENLLARCYLASALEQTGDKAEAEKERAAAVAIKPNDSKAHYEVGSTLALAGRLEAALSQFEAAAKADPSNAAAENDIGLALTLLGRTDAADGHYLRSIQLDPYLPDPHTNLGSLYLSRGKLEPAIQELREAARLKANDAKVHEQLAGALAAASLWGEALREYQRAHALAPNDEEIRRKLDDTAMRMRGTAG